MKLDEFVLLTEDQKISLLWREAIFIAERKEVPFYVYLYQIHSFYIEAWYCSNFINIFQLKSFSNTEELHPYLEKINIGGISQYL